MGQTLISIPNVLSGLSTVLNWTDLAFTAAGVFAAWKTLPRLVRYRLLTRFFSFSRTGRVIIVCSELEDPSGRQWVEETEFIYLMKYGDIDALFELSLMIREAYPNVKLEVMSAQEVLKSQIDFNADFIVIGGPDYNQFAARLIESGHTHIEYSIPDWDDESSSNDQIKLSDKITNRDWSMDDSRSTDYGYIEVLNNPFHDGSRVFMFGGCHTVGVTGAARLFKLQNGSQLGLNKMASKNLKRLLACRGKSEHYGAIFKVELVGETVGIPDLSSGAIFDHDGFKKC